MDASATTGGATTAGDELATWLTSATDDPGPFTVTPLSGGNSNETLLISSPSAKMVLRRPPAATIDASAHNVEREYRVLMALADTHVPVPRPIAIARESTPNGPPGLLMEHLDGVSLTTDLPPDYPHGAASTVGCAAIDALADLHTLPWRDLGLEDFGRPEHFLERQVGRWRKQYDSYRHRDLPDFDVVAAWLEKHRPADSEDGIIHGDCHIDNCLFSPTGPPRLLAIIDWEMSTIGDPLLDVGLMLGLWGTERHEPLAMPRIQGFSRAPGAPTRAQLAERYERRSGRSLEHLNYYMGLALWKLAILLESSYSRFLSGTAGDAFFETLEQGVPRLAEQALAACAGDLL